MKNNIALEMLANKIEKTAILFELYKGLKDFFDKNPTEIVDICFCFDNKSPKETRYISFKSSTDEGKSVVFSNVFHYLHKCVSLFDPIKSPFGLFAQFLVMKPQEVKLTFSKDNFFFIFDYADDFDNKKVWLTLVNETVSYMKYSVYYDKNVSWGKYPTMIFNEKSYNDWQAVKASEDYIKTSYDYNIFLTNANIVKKYYKQLSENQTMTLQKSYITIFEEGMIVDCIELYELDYIQGVFDKKDYEKGFSNFIKYNATMLELNYGLTEKMLMEIFND